MTPAPAAGPSGRTEAGRAEAGRAEDSTFDVRHDAGIDHDPCGGRIRPREVREGQTCFQSWRSRKSRAPVAYSAKARCTASRSGTWVRNIRFRTLSLYSSS